MAVFYNAVLILKSKNMAKSMADFSDYPAILFAMFRRGSISDPSGVDMAPCRSVAIVLNREAGVFFRESPPSALRVESVYNHSITCYHDIQYYCYRSGAANSTSQLSIQWNTYYYVANYQL